MQTISFRNVREEIMSDERISSGRIFTPWTIKGLERDAVVILGGYVAASAIQIRDY